MDSWKTDRVKAMDAEIKLPEINRFVERNLNSQYIRRPPCFLPYETKTQLKDGSTLSIRPICSTDESALRHFFETLSEESIYLRFGQHCIDTAHDHLADLCRVDFLRDFTFLTTVGEDGGTVVGEAQLNRLANHENAEISFIVADKWQGKGIGRQLMEFCLMVARDIGLKTLVMEVMKDNIRMKRFGYKYGFQQLSNTQAGDTEEVFQLSIGRMYIPNPIWSCLTALWQDRKTVSSDFEKEPVIEERHLCQEHC